jgi:hypothetical protein
MDIPVPPHRRISVFSRAKRGLESPRITEGGHSCPPPGESAYFRAPDADWKVRAQRRVGDRNVPPPVERDTVTRRARVGDIPVPLTGLS